MVLLHGFPYDVRCYDDVASRLAAEGADVVVPYPRGHGPTRFVDDTTSRSGQQAALAHDLRELATHWGCGRRWWPATTGAARPRIEVPTVVLDPVDDTISTPSGTHEQPGEPLTPESRPPGRDEPRPGRVLRRSTSPVGLHRE